MGSNKVRVVIPRNPAEELELAKKIYAKHTSFLNSPLNALQDHSWTVNGPEIANAIALHQQAEELARQSEEAYRKRDLLIEEIDLSVRASRDLLLSIYSNNPKALGEWGFEVDDTARAPKATAK